MTLGKLAGISIAVAVAAAAHAQTIPIGAHVRVWSTDMTFENNDTRMAGSRGDTVFFREGAFAAMAGIRRSSLTRLDVRVTKSGSVGWRVVRGATAGAAIGFGATVAGAAIYVAQARKRGTCAEAMCEYSYLLAPPAGLVGAVVGGIVGRYKSFSWIPIADPRQLQIAAPIPPRELH